MEEKAKWSLIGVIVGSVLMGGFSLVNRQILPIESRVFEIAVSDHGFDRSSHRFAVCPQNTRLIGGRCEVNVPGATPMIATIASDGVQQIESVFGGCDQIYGDENNQNSLVRLQVFCEAIDNLDAHAAENGFFCWMITSQSASFSAIAECAP